jgi:hypothetical protein
MPKVDPSQEMPEVKGGEGAPTVHIRLTGQGDSPDWRAIYHEVVATNGCPAEIYGPQGTPSLTVHLTDTSTDVAIRSVLDRASDAHLYMANTNAFLEPPDTPSPPASLGHIAGQDVEMWAVEIRVNAWWAFWKSVHPEAD